MPDLRSVPDDTKWRTATRCSTRLAALYDVIFRPVLKERYDDLEQDIWVHMAQFSYEIAASLQFPMNTARELAESLRSVNTILFGPEFKDEVIEVGDTGAVIIVRRCPHVTGECPGPEDGTFRRCMAFTLTSQKAMNPAFSSRFVRAMCAGDRQCEIRIDPEKNPAKKPDAHTS